jgi:ribonuclease HI
MDKKMNITVSTDGACSGNPGPGGYAAVLRFGPHFKEVTGFEPQTTNNRMELRAVIESLAILKKPCKVTVRTDSHIVCNAIANLDSMPAKGWKTKTGARRANCDLLEQMYKYKHEGNHDLFYEYVKGHDGDPDNERCDTLAKEQIKLHVG